jgi:hypothetical protein
MAGDSIGEDSAMPRFVLLLERQLKRYQDGPTWENRFNAHKAIRLPNPTP